MIVFSETCPRGGSHRVHCTPLANIVSDDETSFICCGANDEQTRGHPGDLYRLCFVNCDTDEMTDNDEFDLLDLSTVITGAMASMRRDPLPEAKDTA